MKQSPEPRISSLSSRNGKNSRGDGASHGHGRAVSRDGLDSSERSSYSGREDSTHQDGAPGEDDAGGGAHGQPSLVVNESAVNWDLEDEKQVRGWEPSARVNRLIVGIHHYRPVAAWIQSIVARRRSVVAPSLPGDDHMYIVVNRPGCFWRGKRF